MWEKPNRQKEQAVKAVRHEGVHLSPMRRCFFKYQVPFPSFRPVHHCLVGLSLSEWVADEELEPSSTVLGVFFLKEADSTGFPCFHFAEATLTG